MASAPASARDSAGDGKSETTLPPNINEITQSEKWEALRRILHDTNVNLSLGPLSALTFGGATVGTIAAAEAALQLDLRRTRSTAARVHFVSRYAASQIVPSLVWDTISAESIRELCPSRVRGDVVLRDGAARSHRALRNIAAVRGALASTVVLSQILRLTDVYTSSSDAYSDRCAAGREPPLRASHASLADDPGAAVRLCGVDSHATPLGMERRGRRRLFPIYENPDTPHVRALVRRYATTLTNEEDASSVADDENGDARPRIPVFWRVPDRHYGDFESWRGFRVQPNWLFRINGDPKRRLLLLEADATVGTPLEFRPDNHKSADLDLQEAAQGFYRIRRLLPETNDGASPPAVLRVLLVDATSNVEIGGGLSVTVRDRVREMDMADVVLNSSELLVQAIVSGWLRRATETADGDRRSGPVTVALDTASPEAFSSIRRALASRGVRVVPRGSGPALRETPTLVYHATPADTVHVARTLVTRTGRAPGAVCALLDTHVRDLPPGIASVCAADVFDRAFLHVREAALRGESATEIQAGLDEGSTILPE